MWGLASVLGGRAETRTYRVSKAKVRSCISQERWKARRAFLYMASGQAGGGRSNQDLMCIWKGPRGSSRESRADAGRLEEGAPLGPRLELPAICARARYRDWRELDGFDSVLEVTAHFGDGLVMALGKSEGERMTFTPAPQLGKWKPSPSQPGSAGRGQR